MFRLSMAMCRAVWPVEGTCCWYCAHSPAGVPTQVGKGLGRKYRMTPPLEEARPETPKGAQGVPEAGVETPQGQGLGDGGVNIA